MIFAGCKKEEDQWLFCEGCDISAWVGEYSGTGDYYADGAIETEFDVPIMLSIENTSGNVLKTSVVVEERFSTSFIYTKNDNDYFIEVPGSSKSLSLTLKKRDSDYKLSGTVKMYHYFKDSIIIDHSISFESYKSDTD